MALSKNIASLVGLILLLAYAVQLLFNVEWHWLSNLQVDEMYKRWSGLLLAVFILFQWALSLTRTVKKWKPYAMKMQNAHKWLGAISPFLFYIHSANMGYGYLLLLSYIFFANTLLGYINLDVIKNNSDALFKGWMIAHVALSLVVSIMMVFHIIMVFYYK